MEDALRGRGTNLTELGNRPVLILILMEDALREVYFRNFHQINNSLNPYSNGRCSKSADWSALEWQLRKS